MKKILVVMSILSVFFAGMDVHAAVVTVSGNVFLDGETNHADISVIFERIAPSVLSDTAFTSSSGQYTIDIETGIYTITFMKDGFFSKSVSEQPLYENTTIGDYTLRVKKTMIRVPFDYPSIQEAIDSASDGDTVLVAPDIYRENISFNGKNITVASHFLVTGEAHFIAETVIDGDRNGHAVEFSNGEDETAVLCGIKITNGNADNGGGVYCDHASPTLKNLVIVSNTANNGGGVCCLYSGASITNSQIGGNTAATGGGLYFGNCTMQNVQEVPEVINCSVVLNYGDGIYHTMSEAQIRNTLIAFNTGNGIYQDAGNNPEITYTAFFSNDNGDSYNCGAWIGKNITVNANGDSCDAYYNIRLDSRFTDMANGDYSLLNTSFCVGAGTTEGAPETDINGVLRGIPPDIGAYENALDSPMHIPVIMTETIPNATEGEYYSFSLDIHDPDTDDVLTFILADAPSWLKISSTGRLYGTPGEYDPGNGFPVTVTVTDSYELADTLMTALDVIDINSKPEILTTSLRNAQENLAYADTVEVRDADAGDVHYFGILFGPSWMTIDDDGIIGGTPTRFDSGENQQISIVVTDSGGLSDTLSVGIDVIDVTNLDVTCEIDTNLAEADSQGDTVLFNPGPENYFGFAVYVKSVTELRSFRITMEWNGLYAALNKNRSGPTIFEDTYDINCIENLSFAEEKNILLDGGGTLTSITEDDEPGRYTVVTAKMGGDAVVIPDGLLYLAVFRIADELPDTDAFTISVGLEVFDDRGVCVPLALEEIVVQEYEGLYPPTHFTVTDVMNDHGHMLQLSWQASAHEQTGLVEYYRIYRSRHNEIGDIRHISTFDDIESLNIWEERNTVFIDSVLAGQHAYIDRCVPLLSVPYYYWLEAVGHGSSSGKIAAGCPTTVDEGPVAFDLSAPYPNPFNAVTTIDYTLPDEMHVSLTVYNLTGQVTEVLCNSIQGPGRYSATWNAGDATSGMYFFVVRAGNRTLTRKALLLK